MKKIIKKFWGVALVVIMISGLLIAATPAAAADPLKWNAQMGTPLALNGFYTSWPGTDITDFAMSDDGMTAFATLDLNEPTIFGIPLPPVHKVLVKSTFGGGMWSDLTDVQFNMGLFRYVNGGNDKLPASIKYTDYVAIAPDDPDIVVVLDAHDKTAAASKDGGLHFYDMGTIQSYNGTEVAQDVYGVEVSRVVSGGIHYVGIPGDTDAGTPAIFYYNLGAAIGSWKNAVTDFPLLTPPGQDPPWFAGGSITRFLAVKFSPGFSGDYTAMAVSEDPTGALHGDGNAEIDLHILSFSSKKWDSDLLNLSSGTAYPVEIDYWDAADAAVTSFDVFRADIALGPEFSGSEEETLITFIGAAIDTNSDNTTMERGIYRVDESGDVTLLKKVGTNSIDYNGTTLAAGMYDNNNVYRSSDPLASSPALSPARSLKRIGINDMGGGGVLTPPKDLYHDQVVVAYAGETLYGSKRGDASAFSKSTDNGYTWNDISLMDSALTYIDDVYFAPDASTWYVAANDWAGGEGEASIYRMSGFAMNRVLCISMTDAYTPNFMLRGITSDANVLWAADKTHKTIFTTTDGGMSKWTNPPDTAYDIADLAVESASVAYYGSGVNVYKTTTRGQTWDDGTNTAVLGAIFQLVSLGEGKLLCSSTFGSIVFSTDGGASYTATMGTFMTAGFVPTYVTATGLGPTDTIFAAPVGYNDVFRAPAAPYVDFKTMNFGGWPGTAVTTGLLLNSGILYVLGAEPVVTPPQPTGVFISHTMNPTISGEHTEVLWGTRYASYLGYSNYAAADIKTNASYSSFRATSSSTSVKLFGAFDWLNLFGTYTPPAIMYFEDIVSLPSSAPVLLGPATDSMIDIVSSTLADSATIVFSWKRASGQITSYELMIAKDKDYTEIIQDVYPESTEPSDIVTAVYGRSILYPLFNPGETYYWKVATHTPFNGVWSETRTFTVAPSGATVPQTAAPANGANDVSKRPSFSWTPVTGTTKYQFQLDTVTTFAAPADDETVTTTAVQLSFDLETGKTYFWRVKALEPIASDWSTIANFTVAVPPTPAPPPVTITSNPPPQITITQPSVPPITFTQPAEQKISPAYIWAIIIIGAVLVIAVIVLIVRTRRSV